MKSDLFEGAFKDEDVTVFTRFMDFVDANGVFSMKAQQAYDFCNLRNQMLLIRKKCSEHVMEHIKTVKATEDKK